MLLTIVLERYFNVTSKDTVHECKIEFGELPVSDVISERESIFLVKWGPLR